MFAAFALLSGSDGLCECNLRGLEDSTCRSGEGGVGDLVTESEAMSDEWTWTGEERDRCMGYMVSAWSDYPRHCQRDSAGSDRIED